LAEAQARANYYSGVDKESHALGAVCETGDEADKEIDAYDQEWQQPFEHALNIGTPITRAFASDLTFPTTEKASVTVAPRKNSVLRKLQIEWNDLVPIARARRLRARNHIPLREVALFPNGSREKVSHRRALVEWLRRELGQTNGTKAPPE